MADASPYGCDYANQFAAKWAFYKAGPPVNGRGCVFDRSRPETLDTISRLTKSCIGMVDTYLPSMVLLRETLNNVLEFCYNLLRK